MIYSYVARRVEDVPSGSLATGVPRFDQMLRRVFPEMVSVTRIPPDLHKTDTIVTDNHLSVSVPEENRTVVVMHGCAQTHYDRDPNWQNRYNLGLTRLQHAMCLLPNRVFVAPSAWVLDQFGLACSYRIPTHIIPHWADPISPTGKVGKPKIIGDWRDNNKGAGVWKFLADRCPQWEFQPLNFRDDAGRRKQYGEADLYLCLSLSEGGSYSMCDAEAAELPIVSTDVGNYLEFDDCEVIRWQDRDNLDLVAAAIDRKMHAGRRKPSFYQGYTFEVWKQKWEEVVR